MNCFSNFANLTLNSTTPFKYTMTSLQFFSNLCLESPSATHEFTSINSWGCIITNPSSRPWDSKSRIISTKVRWVFEVNQILSSWNLMRRIVRSKTLHRCPPSAHSPVAVTVVVVSWETASQEIQLIGVTDSRCSFESFFDVVANVSKWR